MEEDCINNQMRFEKLAFRVIDLFVVDLEFFFLSFASGSPNLEALFRSAIFFFKFIKMVQKKYSY